MFYAEKTGFVKKIVRFFRYRKARKIECFSVAVSVKFGAREQGVQDMIGGSSNFIEAAALLGAVTVKTELEMIEMEKSTEPVENLNLKGKITEKLRIKTRFRRLKKRCKSRSSSIL